MPRADDICAIEVDEQRRCRPSSTRSASRARARPARSARCAAVMNAVIDALAPLGVTTLEMPATPERIWRAIKAARAPR